MSKVSPIRHIYDLLSEEQYQRVFNWNTIRSKTEIRVHHRIFRPLEGTDILPWIAKLLARRLPRFYEESELFKDGEWLDIEPGSHVEFSFEARIGDDQTASREGHLASARRSILAYNPELEILPPDVLEQLAAAEHSLRKAQEIKGDLPPENSTRENWSSLVI